MIYLFGRERVKLSANAINFDNSIFKLVKCKKQRLVYDKLKINTSKHTRQNIVSLYTQSQQT